jgi:hypothetical protein
MKTQFVAALLLAVSATVAAPVFASGYGPAPFYRPSAGAPDSQRGQSAQTIDAARRDDAASQRAYGGMNAGYSESGRHEAVAVQGSVYAHH